MSVEGGFLDGQRRQDVGLVLADRGEPGDGLRCVEGDSVMLDPTQSRQGTFRRASRVARVQPASHDAVDSQCNEADRCVRTNSIWQPVVDRPNLCFRLEYPEATLDVGERLVVFDDVVWCEVGGVGDEQQFAVHQARVRECVVIDGIGERLALEVDAHDARQM